MICFQECSFTVKKTVPLNYSIYSKNKQKCEISFHSDRKPNPDYLNLSLKAGTSNVDKVETRSNIMDILFKCAKDIDRIVDSKGTKYIKLTYHSV